MSQRLHRWSSERYSEDQRREIQRLLKYVTTSVTSKVVEDIRRGSEKAQENDSVHICEHVECREEREENMNTWIHVAIEDFNAMMTYDSEQVVMDQDDGEDL